jgi:broad specificity phosphatase PhoE
MPWLKGKLSRGDEGAMHRVFVLCVAVAALSGLVACQREPTMQAVQPAAVKTATLAEEDRQMVQALRAGGHVIYFRHGATDQSQTDSDPNNLANCATQRNLTDAGREQAQTTGDAFRALGIPVGTVLSSEYCRALEYSRLAFTVAQPERSLDLTDPLTDQQKADSVQNVKRLLGTLPAAGTNTILVSHSPNIRLAVGVDLPVEGEAAIFRVDPSGTSTLVTRVLPTDWPMLARALAAR